MEWTLLGFFGLIIAGGAWFGLREGPHRLALSAVALLIAIAALWVWQEPLFSALAGSSVFLLAGWGDWLLVTVGALFLVVALSSALLTFLNPPPADQPSLIGAAGGALLGAFGVGIILQLAERLLPAEPFALVVGLPFVRLLSQLPLVVGGLVVVAAAAWLAVQSVRRLSDLSVGGSLFQTARPRPRKYDQLNEKIDRALRGERIR